ncbi:MAG: ABC transporter ATP-binding protein [Anaerolineae bacterium]|nr:ABC transporter ATP-binding protein [Anaerolineae bacterium]
MTTIVLENVSKRFEQAAGGKVVYARAVDNVSMRIASGQVLAVLGPSGCGKSTLLRLIAGLLIPDSGRILYDNVPLEEIPSQDRGIGMVFQEGALIPHWEARQNIGFFLWLRHREHEVPERVARISQITGIGLEKLLDRLPGQLSGGERQRVGVARALARDPRVFLFDEPFSNLDAKLRSQARVELRRLLNEFPVTSVYVTHDQVEAIALADRIAVMREGGIEQMGTFQQLYHNPLNLFVATFIGLPTINLFEGEVRDHQWHGLNFGGYPIRADLEDGTRIIMGVRPEFIQVAEEGVRAYVESVIPHFSERHYQVEMSANGEQWVMLVPIETRVEVGDQICCALDTGTITYFDRETQTRVG